MGCLVHLFLPSSISAEASIVVLVMTGVISLSMITRAHGSLAQEEEQEKAGHTAQCAGEPWQQTLLEAGPGSWEKGHVFEHRRDSLHGGYLQGVGTTKITGRSLRQILRLIVLTKSIVVWAAMNCGDFCYSTSLSSAVIIITQHGARLPVF